jgi:hypothetical protein
MARNYKQINKPLKLNTMQTNEFQVLIFDNENTIISSQHYDELPNEAAIYELIKEDKGLKAVIYEVEYPSEFSEFISEYYI